MIPDSQIGSDPQIGRQRSPRPWVGGLLPIMAYTGTLRPKGLPFSGFRYILNPYPFKKVWILQVEAYKRVRKSVI